MDCCGHHGIIEIHKAKKPSRKKQQAAVVALETSLEKGMQKKVLKKLKELPGMVPLSDIEDAVKNGYLGTVESWLSVGNQEHVWMPLMEDMIVGYSQGAEQGKDQIADMIPAGMRDDVNRVAFDPMRPRVVSAIQRQAANMVVNVSETTRDALKQEVMRAYTEGSSIRTSSKRIKEMIGLTPGQSNAMANLRAELEADGWTGDRLEKRMAREFEIKLKRRSENIARTETMGAISGGRRQMNIDLKEQGVMEGLVETWEAALDERMCKYCGPLHGKQVQIGGTWTSGKYTVDNPPLHTNCRCTIIVTEPEGDVGDSVSV